MIYAFVQDSLIIEILKQQREAILSYAESHSLNVDKWLNPSSFTMKEFKEKDVLLLEKTFRLGKDIRTITTILQELLRKGVIICSCEDNLKFGGDYVSQTVMAHMFGVVTDIAEELRSRLTKEALASRKKNGQVLGRPLGRKNSSQKWAVRRAD